MIFPTTYIDQIEKAIGDFAASLSLSKPLNNLITTGTTIVAMINKERKIGILASDGRVSGAPFIFDEKFNKVFGCRIGFFAGAGDLSLIQQIVPAFKLAIDDICDSREKTISASGASRHLMHYYRAAADGYLKRGMQPQIAFVAIFWDEESKKIHLYNIESGAILSGKNFLTIGSGFMFVKGQQKVYKDIPETAEDMIERVKQEIKMTSEEDAGTNTNVYCSIIDNGEFIPCEKPV